MNKPTVDAWNEPSELSGLLARFSYMFPLADPDRSRGYIFFRGWLPTFVTLCERIDAILGDDKRDFEWARIREKFGAPSFAYNMRGRARHFIHAHRPTEVRRIACAPVESFDSAAVAIQEAVLQAEVKLRETCIVCGGRSTISNAVGPWASLCTDHQKSAFFENLNTQLDSVWAAAQIREA